jgi:PKD repeat protein
VKDPEWIFDVEGEYKVSVKLYCSDGRVNYSSAIITVYPRPVAHFEFYPADATVPDDEIRFLNYSSNSTRFRWSFGDGSESEMFEPSHTYKEYGNYSVRLVAISEYGCSDSVTIANAYSASKYYIEFPNAFIPNGQGPTGGFYSTKSDEAAQIFHPSFFGVADYQLKIFSKRGVLIFESSDVSLGWDGYNDGQLCESGVYVWKVRGKFRNGEPFIKMGDVTLLPKQ